MDEKLEERDKQEGGREGGRKGKSASHSSCITPREETRSTTHTKSS
jgi:hypothetical protein